MHDAQQGSASHRYNLPLAHYVKEISQRTRTALGLSWAAYSAMALSVPDGLLRVSGARRVLMLHEQAGHLCRNPCTVRYQARAGELDSCLALNWHSSYQTIVCT
jgi:hypothetical protein